MKVHTWLLVDAHTPHLVQVVLSGEARGVLHCVRWLLRDSTSHSFALRVG